MIIFTILLFVTTILFILDWFKADVVALAFMVSLVLTGILTPEEAFQGFGSDTVILFIGLLTMTAALHKTGVVEIVGHWIVKFCGDNPDRLLLVVMVAVALLSAFISNTAATAFFLPVIFAVTRKLSLSPSKYLLPLAFASILSSSVTLISTSTNIVVSGVMTRYNLPPMGLFELAPIGIPISIAGILYMWFVGRRLLGERGDQTGPDVDFGLRPYLCDVIILEDSPLIGKTLAESEIGSKNELTVLRIVRDKKNYIYPRASIKLKSDDVLLVEGTPESILKIKDASGIEIKADVKLRDPSIDPEDLAIVEAIVLPNSPLLGKSIKSFRLRDTFGIQAIGMTRARETLKTKISDVRVKMGDFFLLQGPAAQIKAAESMKVFDVLGTVNEERPNHKKAALSVAIFLGALALAAFGIIPTAVSLIAGAVVILLAQCITPDEAYKEIDWSLIILVGSMLSAGVAMEKTGAAKLAAEQLVLWTAGADPMYLIAGFFVLAVILTQIMSNQAAAVVLVPIAIQTALALNLNPRSFVFTIAVAASCSYLTPLEPACLMVYGPGGYRFSDFMKVGGLLTVVILGITLLLIPICWPL